MSDSVRPHRRQPTRLPRPWDSPGKNTWVCCHFLLQCMKAKGKVKLLSDPKDCSLRGSSVHGIFQATILEWVAIAFFHFWVEGFLAAPALTKIACSGEDLRCPGGGAVEPASGLQWLWVSISCGSGTSVCTPIEMLHTNGQSHWSRKLGFFFTFPTNVWGTKKPILDFRLKGSQDKVCACVPSRFSHVRLFETPRL